MPIDDTNTLHYCYLGSARETVADPLDALYVDEIEWKHANGRFTVDSTIGQDMMAWVTQGPISARDTERLGTTDKGVILYRSLLLEQIEVVERGEDPLGVIRNPSENESIPVELEGPQHAAVGGFVAGRERLPFSVNRELNATRP